jgi:dCMP deaminase
MDVAISKIITSTERWDDYFFTILDTVKAKSKDQSTKIGCVIVRPDHSIASTGFNGFPRGCRDDTPQRHERPEKYFWFEHGERNAIYNAARNGTALDGCTLYVGAIPCMDCARAIVQSGIRVVVINNSSPVKGDHWEEQVERVRTLFDECGVVFQTKE